MFRTLLIAVFVAVLTAQGAFASHGRSGSGPAQLNSRSTASMCDRLDAELGPKYVPFRIWSRC
jgi:hypothetical protein